MSRRGADAAELRRRAEERLAQVELRNAAATDAEVRRLVHELEVHQIELELQNEELRASRLDTESALRDYAELFDFAPIGYLHVAADGRIREMNFAAARLLGVPRAQLADRTLSSFVTERERPALQRFLTDVLTRTDQDAPGEVGEFVMAQQPARALHVRITAVQLERPTLSALLAIEDVTARRLAEDALRDEARRKDEFLAALSHELRNPLAPIRNGVYVLRRAPAGGEQALGAIDVIDRQVTHLTRLVEDLLDVTRVARGKIRLQRERIDAGAEVRRTVEDHRPAFDAAGVSLACEVGDGCFVDADASRLAQIIGNLLGNALKFTNRGGRVEVSARRKGDRAALRVRDTGVGVAPDVLPRLFEPFSQAPQTLDRTRGGLGLGLATVKGLAELHGGSVEVRSEGPGRGTELTVFLPLVAAAPAARPRGDVSLGVPHRVLVIDDSEDAATSLKDVLELGGHEVRFALDGPSGLAAAREFRPEIVICDLGLPGMSGYEVAQHLRADGSSSGAWLVAMSGYAAPEDVERARRAGFDRHVAKPPTLARLESLFAEAPAPGRAR